MRISVVIPTHNRSALLRRALRSVQAQSLAAAEIIVVDDGSEDDTEACVRKEFPEVAFLRQANAGVSSARNRGITHATCEWLAFLDSDDEWLPAKLERQAALLKGSEDLRICHTDEIWIRDGVRVNPMKKHEKRGGWIFEHCLPLCVMSPSSVVVHRSVLDHVGRFDESLPACEDYDLWLRITCRYPVLFAPEQLVIKYGGHEDQLSRRHWGMDRFRIESLERLVAGSILSDSQRRAARGTLREKVRIFGAGAAKRGKAAEAARYAAKLQRMDQGGPDAPGA